MTTYQPLKHDIVFNQVLLLLSQWWELGYRDMPYGYKNLINLLFPNHIFGHAHSTSIKNACLKWEEKYQTKIDYLLPELRKNSSHWESTIKDF